VKGAGSCEQARCTACRRLRQSPSKTTPAKNANFERWDTIMVSLRYMRKQALGIEAVILEEDLSGKPDGEAGTPKKKNRRGSKSTNTYLIY